MALGQQGYPLVVHELFYREATHTYHVPAHTQKIVQWYCVIHGAVEQRIDRQKFLLNSMESLLIPAQAVREPQARSASVGYVVCTFENKRLNIEPIVGRRLLCPAPLRVDLQEMVAELRAGPSREQQDMLLALLPRILIGLRRGARVKSADRAATGADGLLNLNGHLATVATIEDFMRQHLHDPLSRAQLATVAHLSPSHLARVFRATTGKSVLERLTELRLAQACAMLGESSLPITRIALDVGFNSFSHFTSLFKRKIGLSPSDYRRSGGFVWNAKDTRRT